MSEQPIVFVVDDDPAMRESLRWLIESVSLNVQTFDSAQAFLDGYQLEQWGCLVLDIRMPGLSGLDLQERMLDQGIDLPIIFVTGHGDVQMAVRAIKSGAVDFLEKPFSDQTLLDRIQQSIARHRELREEAARRNEIEQRLLNLSRRERDVFERVVAGMSNRAIAEELGLSPKTVEVHRARVMEKMRARSLPELVRLHFAAKGRPPSA